MINATKDRQELPSAITDRPLILIVDDEADICLTLSGVLQDEDFETIVAKNGIDALAQIREFHPAIVFLDIWMPGWDGIETLEKIKSISPNTEVIMISGHATIANALEAAKRGAFDFIEKPLNIESIVFCAKRALEKIAKNKEINGACGASGVSENAVQSKSSSPMLSHPGVLSTGWQGRNLRQRTIKKGTILYGHCLHSGQKSGLVLEPLPLNSGIHFEKIGDTRTIPAYVDYVESTAFATTIRSDGAKASTIEHLLSALHAYRISNLLVKCNDEVPIFDGSALEFCKVLEQVGIEEQDGDWFEIAVQEPLTIQGKNPAEKITLEPYEGFKISYQLDYPAPVGRQYFEYVFSDEENYSQEIAPARTFGFVKDIERLQKAGLAAGGRLDNFILIGEDRIVNTELRFADELARHKILDIFGDLFLLGRPLRAHVKATMTGHSDNVHVLEELKKRIF